MIDVFTISGIVLIFTIFLCLYRVVAGPDSCNRLIAVNAIGTKTIILLIIIGYIYERPLFLDISLAYAMISFTATLAMAKYLEKGCIC
ncbi:cation:proton antiporter [Methanoculleus sp. FWC-SCC1]|uniref:Cation:proton antiporter n=1 Tax=Methanoculleus frigidifontis TaxID=2584085 RepID=A0ABT8M822_9EURY|nr:monovalent cation/H+ antiporter complex subunit F [Methanoculleus sp. FWC-SCC1]MDN7024090.1 cation:proton antiporter [Methanoculleus sp. FWC-SCC1]